MSSAHKTKKGAEKAAEKARDKGLSAEVVRQTGVRFPYRVDTKRK